MQSLSLNLDFISRDTESPPRADGAALALGGFEASEGGAQDSFLSLLSQGLETAQLNESAQETGGYGLPLMSFPANESTVPEGLVVSFSASAQLAPATPQSALPSGSPHLVSAELGRDALGGKALPSGTPLLSPGLPQTGAGPLAHERSPVAGDALVAEPSALRVDGPGLSDEATRVGTWGQLRSPAGDLSVAPRLPARAARPAASSAASLVGPPLQPQAESLSGPAPPPLQPVPMAPSGADAGANPTAQWLDQAIVAAQSQPAMAASRFRSEPLQAMPVEGAEDFQSALDFAPLEGADAAELSGAMPSGTQRAASAVPVFSLGRGVAAVDWSDALGSRLQMMAGQNLKQAQIRLDPPELGAVEVQISMSERATQVLFTAENAAAREALDAALPRLHELMGQAGFADLQAEVSDGQSGHAWQGEASLADGGRGRDDAADEPIEPMINTSVRAQRDDAGFDGYA